MNTTLSNEPNIGIRDDMAKRAIEVLSRILADQHVLYVKSRNYHWNVRGPHFRELHTLFEEQYEALASQVDATAERIRALGSYAPGYND